MTTATQTCYRHSDKETGVSCSACDRPICPDCMTPTQVGMRCPECSKQRTEVKKLDTRPKKPQLTEALIAFNLIVFAIEIITGGGLAGGKVGNLVTKWCLFGPWVAEGEYWRLLTAGFLHFGFLHLLLNQFVLYSLGSMIEPLIGRWKLFAIYLISILFGSLGGLLIDPTAFTVSASAPVFGLMGGGLIALKVRGIDLWQTGVGTMVLLNLGLTFVFSHMSIGSTIGGLVGGAVAGWLLLDYGRWRAAWVPLGTCIAVAFVVVAIAITVAKRSVM